MIWKVVSPCIEESRFLVWSWWGLCKKKRCPFDHLNKKAFDWSNSGIMTRRNLKKSLRPKIHPRRPRGSQSGREKGRDESFQVRTKEPLGTDSHRTISKNSSGCRLLIGHKKCFVLLCPIGEQFLLSSFREVVHNGYCFDHGLSSSCTREIHTVRKLSVRYKIPHLISKYCLPEN